MACGGAEAAMKEWQKVATTRFVSFERKLK